MTTSSSPPRISEILLAIHLFREGGTRQHRPVFATTARKVPCCALFHDLQVDLVHVDLLIELGGELCALEEPRIDAGSHDASRCCAGRDDFEMGGKDRD